MDPYVPWAASAPSAWLFDPCSGSVHQPDGARLQSADTFIAASVFWSVCLKSQLTQSSCFKSPNGWGRSRYLKHATRCSPPSVGLCGASAHVCLFMLAHSFLWCRSNWGDSAFHPFLFTNKEMNKDVILLYISCLQLEIYFREQSELNCLFWCQQLFPVSGALTQWLFLSLSECLFSNGDCGKGHELQQHP